ncbi:MAG: hypothetical protein ACI8WM_000775 [Burkholderiaceae bacterium]|jgi:hypothetical protein
MSKSKSFVLSNIAIFSLVALSGCGGNGGDTGPLLSASDSVFKATSVSSMSSAGISQEQVRADAQMSIFMFPVDKLLTELGTSAKVTISAQKSGNWGDKATWNSGRVPAAGDVVEVPSPFVVKVDGVYTYPNTVTGEEGSLKAIIVQKDAMLTFNPTVNTKLVVDTIFNNQGTLQIGTPANPIADKVTAVIQFPDADPMFPVSVDPRQVTRGIVSDGVLRMRGRQVTAYRSLTADAQAGAYELALSDKPVGWVKDDNLVLAATTFTLDFYKAQNEELTISSSVADKVVSLNKPIQYSHTLPSISSSAATAPGVMPMSIQVANVSRNIIISSASASVAIPRRGHVMQMSNDANIKGVLFRNLGRTDKTIPISDPTLDDQNNILPGKNMNPRARYALHFHEAGADVVTNTTTEAQVRDSVMIGSPGWGFVNHSSYVHFENNVAYDYAGAGFVTEDGDEAGEFIGNLAMGGRSTGNAPENLPGAIKENRKESMKVIREIFGNPTRMNIGDMGFAGHGFWFQGPDVLIQGNYAAGNKGAGFVTWADGKYDPATGGYTGLPATRVPSDALYKPRTFANGAVVINDVPLRGFDANQAYANFIGVKTRFTNGNGDFPLNAALSGASEQLKIPDGGRVLGTSTIKNLTVWGNRIGIVSSYTKMNYEHVLNVGLGNTAYGDSPASVFQPAVGVYITGPRTLTFSDFRLVNYPTGKYFGNLEETTVPEESAAGVLEY